MVTRRSAGPPRQPRSGRAAGDGDTPAGRHDNGERRTFGDVIRERLQAGRLSVTTDDGGSLQITHPARPEQPRVRRVGRTKDGRITFDEEDG